MWKNYPALSDLKPPLARGKKPERKSCNESDQNTGKSVSEALILESVNPQYDERLFIEFQE